MCQRAAGEGVDEAAGGGVEDAGADGFGIAAHEEVGAEGNVKAKEDLMQANVLIHGCNASVLGLIVFVEMRLD